MKIFTIDGIRNLDPCYDPEIFLPEDWSGTALDILGFDDSPPLHRLWVVLQNDWIDDKIARLFAVWCARSTKKFVGDLDPEIFLACDVAESYAKGESSRDEMLAARVGNGPGAAVIGARLGWYVTEEPAGLAAYNAAGAMAWEAAWGGCYEIFPGAHLAKCAARKAAQLLQAERLIKMLEEEPA